MESALAEADSNDGPTKLRLKIEGLSFDFTDAERAEMAATLPVNERVGQSIEQVRHLMRNQLLEQLRRFPADAKAFRAWLVSAKERYSNWLLRLEPTAVPVN